MTVDQLQDSLAEHKIKIGMMARGLYSMLAQMIGESERIVIAAEGFASGNRAPIIVTDSYVYVASYATMMGGPAVCHDRKIGRVRR